MSTGSFTSPPTATVSGFRAQVGADVARIDELVELVTTRLRLPFHHRMDRYPSTLLPLTWKQWFLTTLPSTLERVSQLLLVGIRVPSLGRAWAITVLEPLADLVGCDIVPREGADAQGSLTEEIAEASVAFSDALLAADRRAPRHELAPKIEKAKHELDDLEAVAR